MIENNISNSSNFSDNNSNIDSVPLKNEKLNNYVKLLKNKNVSSEQVLLKDIRNTYMKMMLGNINNIKRNDKIHHTIILNITDFHITEKINNTVKDEMGRKQFIKEIQLYLDSNKVENNELIIDHKNYLYVPCRLSENESLPNPEFDLLHLPMNKRKLEEEEHITKKIIKKKIKKFKKDSGDKRPDAGFYILSKDDMITYSIPIKNDNKLLVGYKETKKIIKNNYKMVAMDCEMCLTQKGRELTRISLVNEHLEVLLDEFVLPSNPIINYCTQYSGITSEDLYNCKNTLEKIQNMVLEIISQDTILIGHSIENDLMVLKLFHNKIIDTSHLYPHPRGPPMKSALRYLVEKHLKRKIQQAKEGHCSIEDAKATMELALLKIKNGPFFPCIPIIEQNKKITNRLHYERKSALIIGPEATCRTFRSSAQIINYDSNDSKIISKSALQALIHQLSCGCPPNFTWIKINFDKILNEKNINNINSDNDQSIINIARFFVNNIIYNIYKALPKDSIFLLLFCPSTDYLKDLYKLRNAKSSPKATLRWSTEDQENLMKIAHKTQSGDIFCFYKP